MVTLDDLRRIAEIEFNDIVQRSITMETKLRIVLRNRSFVDVYLSRKLEGRFGFHWECSDLGQHVYRYDNFPNDQWKSVQTYPYHFHKGTQDKVEAAPFPGEPLEGFRAFMNFVRAEIFTRDTA